MKFWRFLFFASCLSSILVAEVFTEFDGARVLLGNYLQVPEGRVPPGTEATHRSQVRVK